ncbi:MAG: hypothetical protein HY517_03290 [Candidatus Aenigmarchaeota archaeon]|nr:hypothetical protein [Candidatus Aenigmarchaeota archaeon]
MKEQNSLKRANFRESGETANKFTINLPEIHITDFWVNSKNDEIREILTYEIRELEFDRECFKYN